MLPHSHIFLNLQYFLAEVQTKFFCPTSMTRKFFLLSAEVIIFFIRVKWKKIKSVDFKGHWTTFIQFFLPCFPHGLASIGHCFLCVTDMLLWACISQPSSQFMIWFIPVSLGSFVSFSQGEFSWQVLHCSWII